MLYPFLLSTSYYVYQRPFLLNIYLKYLFICHLNFPIFLLHSTPYPHSSTCNLSNSFSLIVHVSEQCRAALQTTALIIFIFKFSAHRLRQQLSSFAEGIFRHSNSSFYFHIISIVYPKYQNFFTCPTFSPSIIMFSADPSRE